VPVTVFAVVDVQVWMQDAAPVTGVVVDTVKAVGDVTAYTYCVAAHTADEMYPLYVTTCPLVKPCAADVVTE